MCVLIERVIGNRDIARRAKELSENIYRLLISEEARKPGNGYVDQQQLKHSLLKDRSKENDRVWEEAGKLLMATGKVSNVSHRIDGQAKHCWRFNAPMGLE